MRRLPERWPQASFLLLSVVRRSELKGRAGRGIIPGRETERGRCTEEDAPEWPIWAVGVSGSELGRARRPRGLKLLRRACPRLKTTRSQAGPPTSE